jgi:N-carbamoyl-L-amino-acid hydrolase
MNAPLRNLKIDPARLWSTLMETAEIGGTAKGGICRLTLTDEDRRVRDWFRAQCEALGCSVTIDEMGNMFALRPGRRTDIAPIALGSHLDTQPTGGKFDGVLGVLGGLEALRTLADLNYETNAPLLLVNWTNEEGSRFAPSMLGSAVYAGLFDRAYADAREDRAGVRFGDALDGIGYRGEAKAGSVPIGALFELHIEQGPILEAEGKMIGIVEGVQGIRWYEVLVTGRESHSGSTPMRMRKDALLAATTLMQKVEEIALKNPPGVGTVGLVEARPNSRNIIPGEVFFTVDLRHPEAAVLDAMEAEFAEAVNAVKAARGVEIAFERIFDSTKVMFAPECIACVEEAAAANGFAARRIMSGPGHDATYIARVAPTAMIFVPCKDGLSHNEAESSTLEECAAGAQVLLDAVLAYDRRFAGEG